ncbi:hypothetical protein FA13DRAFT_1018048 [Coprinellus micaceus]|uniref:Uncharacterized protein n=1 Tax=Coprinellus micaceus TaxID=71717 RepID=A0A4Y7RNB3_COPMI|nr:hypothetical protein FA13DRAFT_1018048 [Coprinellus micaceus]
MSASTASKDGGGPRPDPNMFGLAQSPVIGTVDTRVAGSNIFSTTLNYTSNVFTGNPGDSGHPDT